jgi:hypothetical protein
LLISAGADYHRVVTILSFFDVEVAIMAAADPKEIPTTSKVETLKTIFARGEFQAAKVQREYQWQSDHVQQLYDDLVAAFERVAPPPAREERHWADRAA